MEILKTLFGWGEKIPVPENTNKKKEISLGVSTVRTTVSREEIGKNGEKITPIAPIQKPTVEKTPLNLEKTDIKHPSLKNIDQIEGEFVEFTSVKIAEKPEFAVLYKEYEDQFVQYCNGIRNQYMPKPLVDSCNEYLVEKKYGDKLLQQSLFRGAFLPYLKTTVETFSKDFVNYPDIDEIRSQFLNSIVKMENRKEMLGELEIEHLDDRILALKKRRALWSLSEKEELQNMEKLDAIKFLYLQIGDLLPSIFYWGLVELMLPGFLLRQDYDFQEADTRHLLELKKKQASVALNMLAVTSKSIRDINDIIHYSAYKAGSKWSYLLDYEQRETGGLLMVSAYETTTPSLSVNLGETFPKMFRKALYAFTVYETDQMLAH